MVKRIFLSVLFFFIAQIVLFCLVSKAFPQNMEEYLYNLLAEKAENRYGELYSKKILFNPEIKLVQGFNRKDYSDSLVVTISQLSSNEIDAYLSYLGELEDLTKEHADLMITGRNVFALNTGFLVRKSSGLKLKDRSGSVFARYFTWLRKALTGDFGKNDDNSSTISDLIKEKLPKTLFLVIYSILLNTIISIGLAYIVIMFFNRASSTIESLMELMSVIPDFIIALFLIFIFRYNLGIYSDYKEVFREFNFSYLHSNFLKSMYYFLFPAVTIAFSNGNISFLFKNLLEKMQSIRSGVFFKTSKANGMKKRYLYFVFIFKEILPMTFKYISQRIPLIIGASIIVDWVFNVRGIGYLMVKNFQQGDIGCILVVFSLLYLFSIILDYIADYLAKLLQPREARC